MSSKSAEKLLFTGELPPRSITGLSVSNQVNISILSVCLKIDIDEEVFLIGRSAPSKFLFVFKRIIRFIFLNVFNRYKYYYSNLSLSRIGIFKSLIFILCFRLFNKGRVIIHIHRGDVIPFIQNRFFKWLFAQVIRSSDTCIVLSKDLTVSLNILFRNLDCEFVVLENTIENEYDITSTKRSTRDAFTFIYISNYIKDKGILDLLRAFKHFQHDHPDCILKCFGQYTSEPLKREMQAYASEKIIINEQIVGKEKFEELASADCFILPSRNEGKPVAIIEAMYCHLPIIATRVGFIEEMFPTGYPYLYEPGDNMKLEELMEQVINSDVEIIGDSLRARYESCYSYDKHRRALLGIFDL